MRRACFAILVALGSLLLGAATPAWSLDYYLSRDLGVHGLFHLCVYSNGKVYSFNATQLCPLQVSDDGPATPPGGSITGFKVGEYQDGMTKVCVYNALGNLRAVRIGSADLCPLSYNF